MTNGIGQQVAEHDFDQGSVGFNPDIRVIGETEPDRLIFNLKFKLLNQFLQDVP